MLKRKFNSFSCTLIDSAVQYFDDNIRSQNSIGPDYFLHVDNFAQQLCDIKDSVAIMADNLLHADTQLTTLHEKLSKESQKSNVLQDFLVNELQHSEQLEADILKLREQYASSTRQRDFYKKMYDSHIEEINMIAAKEARMKGMGKVDSTGSQANDSGPGILSRLLLKRYIRKCFNKKYFYGMVVSYTAPYYKIVYEDGDSEDMNYDEVNKTLVSVEDARNIDAEVLDTIRELAVQFDSDNPGALFQGVVDVAPAEEEQQEEEEARRQAVMMEQDLDVESIINQESADGECRERGDVHTLNGHVVTDVAASLTGDTAGMEAIRRPSSLYVGVSEVDNVKLSTGMMTSEIRNGHADISSTQLSTARHENGVDIVFLLDDSSSTSDSSSAASS